MRGRKVFILSYDSFTELFLMSVIVNLLVHSVDFFFLSTLYFSGDIANIRHDREGVFPRDSSLLQGFPHPDTQPQTSSFLVFFLSAKKTQETRKKTQTAIVYVVEEQHLLLDVMMMMVVVVVVVVVCSPSEEQFMLVIIS